MDHKLAERQPKFNELNAAQLEAMNTVMKLMYGGPSAGITYAYDAQGRVAEMRASGNFGFDRVTTISYNEHGDKSAQRETMTRDSADPIVTAYSIDPNGTIIPERRATEPTESPALPRENEVRYEYEYDSYGNWTQQTEQSRQAAPRPRPPSQANVLLTRGTFGFSTLQVYSGEFP